MLLTLGKVPCARLFEDYLMKKVKPLFEYKMHFANLMFAFIDIVFIG